MRLCRFVCARDDIEGVADVDVHVFILRSVVDAVFTSKENAAL